MPWKSINGESPGRNIEKASQNAPGEASASLPFFSLYTAKAPSFRPVRGLYTLLLLWISLLPLSALNFYDHKDPDLLSIELANAMTHEELLGQVLMFGWESHNVDNLHQWIELGLGSIKVFGWNGGDALELAETIGRYQQTALDRGRFDIPLFVATDQEGGWVRHVTDKTSQTPGNMAIGASGLAQDSFESSSLIARELRYFGINMNFAPNVDLYLNKTNSIVSSRSFSADPEEAAWLSLAWYKGQQRNGIVATAKHFPGHGEADSDSHGSLPVIHTSLDSLREKDLVPYRMLIHSGLNAIMVGHLGFPEITEEVVPSSRSYLFLTELLRQEMGFKGIVITDDMIMYGARYGGEDMSVICEESMRAGADLLLVSRSTLTHQYVWDHFIDLMQQDTSFYQRVKEAAIRVLRVKLMDLKGENAVPLIPDTTALEESLPDAEMAGFNRNLALRSITLVRGENPVIPEESSVLVVSQNETFALEAARHFRQVEYFPIPYDPGPGQLTAARNRLKETIDNYDNVIISYINGRDSFILDQMEPWADKITLILCRNPQWIEELPWCRSALAIYMDSDETVEVSIGILAGKVPPFGRLPLAPGESF